MRVLICGITGQDGSYLGKLLLEKGFEVIGTSRDAQTANHVNLNKLGILRDIEFTSMALKDFHSVFSVIQKHRPDQIFNLAGQTSVGLSFSQPNEALESIALGTLNILEAIKLIDKPIRLYNAGSSECFGDTGDRAADEDTPFRPRSPYAVAKASAHWLVDNYRKSYDLFCVTGILFNHESPLRPDRFVTQKIVHGAARIAKKNERVLELGNIEISRDWGWAPDYVEAMWAMLQQDQPEDYVVATGQSNTLRQFVEQAFNWFGLDWKNHVVINPDYNRPSDIMISKADPSKAFKGLGWKAKYNMENVVDLMCEATDSSFKQS